MAKKKQELYSVEVTLVLSKIEKCLKYEKKVQEDKAIDLYRELSAESIKTLEGLGYEIETYEVPVSGVYHRIAWEF